VKSLSSLYYIFYFVNDNRGFMDYSRSLSWVLLAATCLLAAIFWGCTAERRKSDAELGLNPQQAAGRRIYDERCDRCHEPYSSRSKKGDSLKGVFQKQYLPKSGLPARDDSVAEIVRSGRGMMPAFGQVLGDQQIQDLLAYVHTL
jgi:mono/diheme cytochrome c family protein